MFAPLAHTVNGKDHMNDIIINLERWRITNDDVMGGVSNGIIAINDNSVIFSGVLSTENNGGFSSAYIQITQQEKKLATVTFKATGDGQPYQLRFRRLYRGYIISYKLPFRTIDNQTTNYHFKLADAQATFRGRFLSNAPILTSESITDVGLLITGKKSIPFNLTLHQINFSK